MAVVPSYNALPDFVSFSDLLNHAIAFMVLFILLERAYPDLDTSKRFSLLFGYAILIEIIQYFLPSRFAAISDVAADSVGIVIALALIPLIRKIPFCRYFYREGERGNGKWEMGKRK